MNAPGAPVILFRPCPECDGEACARCEGRGLVEAGLSLAQVERWRDESQQRWHRSGELALVVRQVLEPLLPALDDPRLRADTLAVGIQWLRKLRLALEVFNSGRRRDGHS